MSTIVHVRCDYCGEAIIEDQSYVTIDARGTNVRGGVVKDFLGHFHNIGGTRSRWGCYSQVLDALALMQEWGPVVSQRTLYDGEVADARRTHNRPCDPDALDEHGGRLLGELHLSERAERALGPCVATVGELCGMTIAELGDIDGIGPVAVDEVIAALARFGLALAAPVARP